MPWLLCNSSGTSKSAKDYLVTHGLGYLVWGCHLLKLSWHTHNVSIARWSIHNVPIIVLSMWKRSYNIDGDSLLRSSHIIRLEFTIYTAGHAEHFLHQLTTCLSGLASSYCLLKVSSSRSVRKRYSGVTNYLKSEGSEVTLFLKLQKACESFCYCRFVKWIFFPIDISIDLFGFEITLNNNCILASCWVLMN